MSTSTRAVMRRLEAALNAGQIPGSTSGLRNCASMAGPSAPRDIEQIRAPLWSAVPHIQSQLEGLIVEGEWAAVHWTVHGRHTGAFSHPRLGSAPASGKSIGLAYMDHYRVVGGHITGAWEVRDGQTLQQQLGVHEPPAAPPPQ